MDEILKIAIVVCPFVFVAGFVDSIAGGGGIISLPAYFLVGVPPHMALGTNKFVATFGTALAAIEYMAKGKVLYKVAIISACGSVLGSFLGTHIALALPSNILKYLIIGLLPFLAVFMTVNKNFGSDDSEMKDYRPVVILLLSFAIGLVIGCYDGIMGPGTGTFLLLAFSAILGIDLLTASGCAKLSNLASNLTSMIIFIINGKVLFAVALPAAAFGMLGNFLGARYAIRGGSKNVKKVMFVVLGLLFIKLGYDLLTSLSIF